MAFCIIGNFLRKLLKCIQGGFLNANPEAVNGPIDGGEQPVIIEVPATTPEPVAPAESTPDATTTPTAPYTDVDPTEAIRQQNQRHEQERIQRETGRSLTPEESEIIAIRHLPRNELSALDSKTQAIIDKYDHLTKPSKFKKFLQAAGRVAGTAVVGATLRTAIKTLLPGIGFAAGTITGAAIGGFMGYRRAKTAEIERLHSSQSVLQEYNAIKSNQEDENAHQNAVAFLQNFLENKRFKGNLSELLDIVAFYKKEAQGAFGEREIDGHILTALTINGTGFTTNFEKKAALAIDSKKLWKAAGRGALIGAGFGMASDLIGAWISHVRADHAREAFIGQHSGTEHQINLSNEQAPTTTESMTFDPQHLEKVAQGLNSDPTDFGNALSHAVKTGFDSAHQSLQMPAELANMPVAEQQNLLQQFFHDLNYAHPSTDNAFVGYHNTYDFNNGALQMLVDKAFHGASYGADGIHLDPHSYLGSIVNADQVITNEFANSLAHGAAEAAKEAATQGLAENLIHGAAIGAAVGLKGEKNYKRHGESLIGGGTGGDETPTTAVPATPANGEARVIPAVAPESAPPEDESVEIDWDEEKDKREFSQTAKSVVSLLAAEGWTGLEDVQIKNLESLFKFAKDNGYKMKFKKNGTELGSFVDFDNADDKKIMTIETENAPNQEIDLKSSDATNGLELTSIIKEGRNAAQGRHGREQQATRRQPRQRQQNTRANS